MSKPKLVEQWYLIQAISRDPKMERADVAIAIELLDRMDDEGVAWSVYERLEKITQQSSRSVERSIQRHADRAGDLVAGHADAAPSPIGSQFTAS